jgi:transposase-like protein
MASVLHGSARTTPRTRAGLQASKESARSLAARYDLNPKTVRKWRQRTNGTKGSEEHGADTSRGSHRGGIPPEDAVAAGRRVGLPERYHSQPQPERPTSLPATPWDLPAA